MLLYTVCEGPYCMPILLFLRPCFGDRRPRPTSWSSLSTRSQQDCWLCEISASLNSRQNGSGVSSSIAFTIQSTPRISQFCFGCIPRSISTVHAWHTPYTPNVHYLYRPCCFSHLLAVAISFLLSLSRPRYGSRFTKLPPASPKFH